jgi:hypothetical protein
MTGGTTEYLGARDSGTINLYGGLIADSLGAWEWGVINIFGYDLDKTNSGGRYGYGQVFGSWTDGTEFTIDLNGADTYWQINLFEIVEVEVDIRPKTVNLSSKGKWISCKVWLPEDYNVADVNSASVLLEGEMSAEWIWLSEKQNVVMVKFPRSEVAAILEPGYVELTVGANLVNGTYFEGRDIIKVIDTPDRKD